MSFEYIDVKLFGQSFQVLCPFELKKDLENAADYLNKRLNDLKIKTGISNTEKLIFITALNISYELKNEKLKIKEIISRLNKIILYLKKLSIIKKK
ncbi:MAG: cell division protein ZapA [Buchnera aphidicola (Nurudea shiraii)]